MIGRVVTEVGIANVSDFGQRPKISAETSPRCPGGSVVGHASQRDDR
ncbi:MAG: hypothetical protein IKH32_10870 [Prevotella sp.]|nr:hypothetical protein [Prevotella sp.]